jgi:branched-chain amino acid transport system substrate-binding protein
LQPRLLRLLAILFAFALIAAACGDDEGDDTAADDGAAATDTAADDGAATDTAAADDGAATATDTAAADDGAATDTAAADDGGADDGAYVSPFEPVGEATGEPIKVGYQNPEGDPNGSFPEASAGARAAAAYINAELGGLGGRPIELEVCTMAITPDDSQRCANELASSGVELAVHSINFFGNHYAIYQGSNIPSVVGSPVTVADFTTPGVYSIGGGCLAQHTGLVQFATQELPGLAGIEVNRVAVPWADTPPGVVCYYDLESKPLDVLNGTVEGSGALAGSMPDLEHIGVPILPGQADVTAQATEVLDFDPDVILFSAQGADCWTFVDAMGRLGWTPTDTPLVLSGACVDFTAMEQAGELAQGIYFIGAGGSLISDPATMDPASRSFDEATIYQTKALEYGMSEDDLFKGFGTNGFQTMMAVWQMAKTVTDGGGEVTAEAIGEAFAATEEVPVFGSTPISCASAPEPYLSTCNTVVNVLQWDGTTLVPVVPELSGVDLVAGTELLPGPY